MLSFLSNPGPQISKLNFLHDIQTNFLLNLLYLSDTASVF